MTSQQQTTIMSFCASCLTNGLQLSNESLDHTTEELILHKDKLKFCFPDIPFEELNIYTLCSDCVRILNNACILKNQMLKNLSVYKIYSKALRNASETKYTNVDPSTSNIFQTPPTITVEESIENSINIPNNEQKTTTLDDTNFKEIEVVDTTEVVCNRTEIRNGLVEYFSKYTIDDCENVIRNDYVPNNNKTIVDINNCTAHNYNGNSTNFEAAPENSIGGLGANGAIDEEYLDELEAFISSAQNTENCTLETFPIDRNVPIAPNNNANACNPALNEDSLDAIFEDCMDYIKNDINNNQSSNEEHSNEEPLPLRATNPQPNKYRFVAYVLLDQNNLITDPNSKRSRNNQAAINDDLISLSNNAPPPLAVNDHSLKTKIKNFKEETHNKQEDEEYVSPRKKVKFCKYCGKQFSRSSSVTRHEQCHGNSKHLYRCRYCPRRFGRSRDVQYHEKATHSK